MPQSAADNDQWWQKRGLIYITVGQEIKHGLGEVVHLCCSMVKADYITFVMTEALRFCHDFHATGNQLICTHRLSSSCRCARTSLIVYFLLAARQRGRRLRNGTCRGCGPPGVMHVFIQTVSASLLRQAAVYRWCFSPPPPPGKSVDLFKNGISILLAGNPNRYLHRTHTHTHSYSS